MINRINCALRFVEDRDVSVHCLKTAAPEYECASAVCGTAEAHVAARVVVRPYRTEERKARVRSTRGLSRTSTGSPDSQMTPPSMKIS